MSNINKKQKEIINECIKDITDRGFGFKSKYEKDLIKMVFTIATSDNGKITFPNIKTDEENIYFEFSFKGVLDYIQDFRYNTKKMVVWEDVVRNLLNNAKTVNQAFKKYISDSKKIRTVCYRYFDEDTKETMLFIKDGEIIYDIGMDLLAGKKFGETPILGVNLKDIKEQEEYTIEAPEDLSEVEVYE